MTKVSRRAALKAVGAGVGTAALLPWLSDNGLIAFAAIQETNRAPSPKVLSAPQFATLEALVEAIIPTDDRSPGAKQARVADYIDLLLSESPRELTLQWLGGLAALAGEEMVSRIRPARPELKVLYVTGHIDQLMNERPVLWEGEAFLDKPFSVNGLLEAVSMLLYGKLNTHPPNIDPHKFSG